MRGKAASRQLTAGTQKWWHVSLLTCLYLDIRRMTSSLSVDYKPVSCKWRAKHAQITRAFGINSLLVTSCLKIKRNWSVRSQVGLSRLSWLLTRNCISSPLFFTERGTVRIYAAVTTGSGSLPIEKERVMGWPNENSRTMRCAWFVARLSLCGLPSEGHF